VRSWTLVESRSKSIKRASGLGAWCPNGPFGTNLILWLVFCRCLVENRSGGIESDKTNGVGPTPPQPWGQRSGSCVNKTTQAIPRYKYLKTPFGFIRRAWQGKNIRTLTWRRFLCGFIMFCAAKFFSSGYQWWIQLGKPNCPSYRNQHINLHNSAFSASTVIITSVLVCSNLWLLWREVTLPATFNNWKTREVSLLSTNSFKEETNITLKNRFGKNMVHIRIHHAIPKQLQRSRNSWNPTEIIFFSHW